MRTGIRFAAATLLLVSLALGVHTVSAQRRRDNKIKLGTIAPKNSIYHEMLMRMRQDWREISDGGVDLAVYPGGVAGDEITMLRKMRAGQMQAALISGSGMSLLDEGISAMQIPLMFESLEEFDYVLGKMAPVLEGRLKDKGYTVLAWGDAGWAHFFGVREFRTAEDLRSMKLYTSKGDDEMLQLYAEFGFRAVPLDLTELQANLETGLVEVFAVPPLVAAGYQWFGSAPYMLDMRFIPIVGALLIANDAWERVPEGQRGAMRDAVGDAVSQLQGAVRRQEAEAIVQMEKYGLKVVKADAELASAWRREVESSYPGLRDRYAPADLMDAAFRWRDEYRSR